MNGSWRIDENGHLGAEELTPKTDLIAALEAWLTQSTAPTLGDPSSFGRRPCGGSASAAVASISTPTPAEAPSKRRSTANATTQLSRGACTPIR